MCDFKIGDDVAVVGNGSGAGPTIYRLVMRLLGGGTTEMDEGEAFRIEDMMRHPVLPWVIGLWLEGRFGWHPHFWFRKVQKPKTNLSVETFLTIKPGFEEPRRTTPARKRERA